MSQRWIKKCRNKSLESHAHNWGGMGGGGGDLMGCIPQVSKSIIFTKKLIFSKLFLRTFNIWTKLQILLWPPLMFRGGAPLPHFFPMVTYVFDAEGKNLELVLKGEREKRRKSLETNKTKLSTIKSSAGPEYIIDVCSRSNEKTTFDKCRNNKDQLSWKINDSAPCSHAEFISTLLMLLSRLWST